MRLIVHDMIWTERYEGQSGVYMTGVDIENGGMVKVSGEFPKKDFEPGVRGKFEAEVKGRQYGKDYALRVEGVAKFTPNEKG